MWFYDSILQLCENKTSKGVVYVIMMDEMESTAT